MDESVIGLINAYMSSKDYKNESWYRKLDDDEKKFVDKLDASINKGIEEGIRDYQKSC